MWELFAIGFAAGLALAIPVGPMAIMLINNTVSRGFRHGVVGALGMASVDGLYALTVFAVGAAISVWLSVWGLYLNLIGAGILLWLGASTVVKSLAILRSAELPEPKLLTGGLGKTLLTFMGATVVNPPTALYFLAIAPNVASLGYPLSLTNVALFALGVFVGSIIWQEGLVRVGLAVRGITTPKVRTWIGVLGGVLIVALAISMAGRALWN